MGNQIADDSEFVADLGPAEDDHVRPLGLSQQLREDCRLPLHQPTSGVRQERRQLGHRCLLSVHDAETIGDEQIPEVGQLAGERGPLGWILACFTSIESDVLEHHDSAVGRSTQLVSHLRHISCDRHIDGQQARQLLSDRGQAGLRSHDSLGSPEVGQQQDARPVVA